MRPSRSSIVARTSLVALFALSAGAASAQQQSAQQPAAPPAAVPDKMPFDVPYGTDIGLARAQRLITAADAEAHRRDWKMNVAVVDAHGELVAFERMDGAQLPSIAVAQNKARTSARWRRETRVFFKIYDAGKAFPGTLDPQLVAAPGGFPLIENGKIIGAIGCSGGMSEQDEIVCKAGIAALQP